MATGSRIRAQIAIIPKTKCELCEDNDIKWKCFTCEEFLCDICKRSHLKGKATRNHKITSTEGSEQQQLKYKKEGKEGIKCHTHTREDVMMYCEQCQTPLCRDCIVSGLHNNHPLMKNEEIIEDKHKELSQMINESNKELSKYEDAVNSIQKNEIDYSGKIADQIDKVKSRNAQLKSELDKIANEVITRLQKAESKYQEQMKKRKNEIEREISDIKKLINECMDKQTQRDVEFVQFVIQLKQRPDQFKPYYPPRQVNPPSLKITDANVQKELKELFGDLSLRENNKSGDANLLKNLTLPPTINVKVISTFPLNGEKLVAAVDETHALIGSRFGSNVSLVTSDGKVIQTTNTNFKLEDLTVTMSGELLFTEADGNKVKNLRPNGKFINIYQAEPGFITQGITVTDDNNIVVCVFNNTTKEGKLVQLNNSGYLISTIQYDTDDKTCLFDVPCRVSSNRNGDLIVLQANNVVVVVNKTGHSRFTYKGQVEGLKGPFSPDYIVTDKYQHIIISDYKNDAIHLLNKDGKFLSFIWTYKLGLTRPRGISIDKSNRLWVCSHLVNKLMIVKYV